MASTEITPAKIMQLASFSLTNKEIAAVLDCSESTLKRQYQEVLTRGRELMRASLKRKQFEIALEGDKTMLIWLGKQHLGQRDKFEGEVTERRFYMAGSAQADATKPDMAEDKWQDKYSQTPSTTTRQ